MPIRRIGADSVLPAQGLLDLSLPLDDKRRLQRRLLGASVRIRLEEGASALHPAALDYIEEHLVGRTPMAWVEGANLNVGFAVQGEQELESIRTFAESVTRVFGGRVMQASIFGILASAQDSFMKQE